VFGNFKKIWSVLSISERRAIYASATIFLVAFLLNNIIFAKEHAAEAPLAGGVYTEGIVGQPTFINPVIAGNNDADRDLIRLVFNSLTDIAESINASEDGKAWTIRLKENVIWHDGEPMTSDDVIFTIDAIQDPDSNSPLSRTWQGVVAERVSAREIRLRIRTPYAFFENNLSELFIIPKHIFGDVPPVNFKLSDYNLKPLGSGPFKFANFTTRRDGFITEFLLEQNKSYFGSKPLIEKINIKFYADEDKIIDAFNSRQIDGFGGIDPSKTDRIKIRHTLRELAVPQYYAIFFNQNSNPAFADKNVRLALERATDKASLLQQVIKGHGKTVSGPVPPFYYPENGFSIEEAAAILDAAEWLPDPEDNGVRSKTIQRENVKLDFVLIIPQIDFLAETAQILKDDWAKIGVRLNVAPLDPRGIVSERIQPRDYEMLLFGNILNGVPDLFSFWHSSEKYFPGLNLSLYDSKTADALLESIRGTMDPQKRASDLAALQSLIYNDMPAVFLYSPDYLYVSIPALEGFDDKAVTTAAHRFDNIEQWHTKSIRILQF